MADEKKSIRPRPMPKTPEESLLPRAPEIATYLRELRGWCEDHEQEVPPELPAYLGLGADIIDEYMGALGLYQETGMTAADVQEAVDIWKDCESVTDIPATVKSWVERCIWHVKKCAELESEITRYRRLEELMGIDRLEELVEADTHGMVLLAELPIGTKVYQLNKGESEVKRIIDGEEYTKRVPNWYITRSEYSWIDAMVNAEHDAKRDGRHHHYYTDFLAAVAERDRINSGAVHPGEDGDYGPD